MEPGKKYLIIITFGWGLVGTFRREKGLNEVELDDCHFITNCGQQTDWGRFARNGPGSGAVVNALGTTTVNMDHHLFYVEFLHDLPRSR